LAVSAGATATQAGFPSEIYALYYLSSNEFAPLAYAEDQENAASSKHHSNASSTGCVFLVGGL
jgi:hypothetical protein